MSQPCVTTTTFRTTCRSLALIAVALACGAMSVGWRGPTRVRAQERRAARTILAFDSDWLFSRGDFATAALPAFDDSAWRRVDLPHDWSAEGPFGAEYGSGNGYAPAGVAWYRKHFTLPADLEGQVGAIEFDGVYDHAEIWVNGHFAGGRPYGYSSFECPLTPYVTVGTADNVVAVRVDHSRFADSRWYTGSGIYRHVRVRFTDALHIAQWGTAVSTPTVGPKAATVKVETTIENRADRDRTFELRSDVMDGAAVVATSRTAAIVRRGERRAIVQQTTVGSPHRWSIASPALYVVRQQIRDGQDVIDQAETTFGIRTTRFDPAQGFFLNDVPVKIKGVCVHHDAGSLGAAVPQGAWERRLRTLAELGVNAIRTSHNPPAPEFLDLCDRLGLLVMDEAFDEFTPTKNKWVSGWNVGVPSRFGYGESFAQWAVRDIEDMVRRDRNHPSIVAWSIGNEIDYPNDPFSHPVLGKNYRPANPPAASLVACAQPLAEAVRKLDPTRPVTAALASLTMSDAVGLPALLDVVGYNYQESRYADDHQRYGGRVILGSENNHQYANWAIVRDRPYVAGQFLWTGIDYLGEARVFPNRANGAGLLDLCGFRKPVGAFRQSLWADAPMVYLAASPAVPAPARGARVEEHWNWPEGSRATVVCYTNCEEVELTLNGRPVGAKRLADAVDGALTWEVPYAPGVLEAVATAKGKPLARFALKTAGPPARIELVPDVTRVSAGGDGTFHVEFRIVDERGVRVPAADSEVTFELEGPGRVLGIGNADLNSIEDCKDLAHHAYQGRGLAVLQATAGSGTITVKASSPGLQPAAIAVVVGDAGPRH
jgi:beta-galactosidase